MERKTWDEYFMDIAKVVATRGTCNKLKVGTVIVKDKQIVSTGFNGSPPGHPHCEDVGCLLNEQNRCIRCTHSEQSAILFADREKLKGATVYVTHEPCENCTRMLVQAGIIRIIYENAYENPWNKHFLQDIEVIHFKRIN